jgi:hypothetical protein
MEGCEEGMAEEEIDEEDISQGVCLLLSLAGQRGVVSQACYNIMHSPSLLGQHLASMTFRPRCCHGHCCC